MSTITKQNNLGTYAKTKRFVYITDPTYFQSTIDNTKYAHPTISFYELYEYNGQFSKGFRKFYFQYQTHKDDKGNWLPAYSGNIEGCNLENLDDINKIVQAANRKQKDLNLYCGDKYHNMISALRAAGYKEGHGDDNYITWID